MGRSGKGHEALKGTSEQQLTINEQQINNILGRTPHLFLTIGHSCLQNVPVIGDTRVQVQFDETTREVTLGAGWRNDWVKVKEQITTIFTALDGSLVRYDEASMDHVDARQLLQGKQYNVRRARLCCFCHSSPSDAQRTKKTLECASCSELEAQGSALSALRT